MAVSLGPAPRGRAWALLALLTALNTLSFVDRQIIPAVAPLLIDDLGLTNAQIGLLYGYAFVLCFILSGIVIGPIADRVNRPRLIAAGLAVWSAATAVSGLARSFGQLAAARVFVGIGEATVVPAGMAMLTDAFPLKWRARAAGVFGLGVSAGTGLSLVIAGVVAPRFGWRACFYALGIIGVIAAAGVAMVRDVRSIDAPPSENRPRSELLRFIGGSPALILTMAGGVLLTFSSTAMIHQVTWLVRERGFEFRQAALLTGAFLAIGGAFGGVAGGWFADVCESRWRGGRLWSLVVAQALLAPLSLLLFWSGPGSPAFYAGWAIASVRTTFWYGPLYTTANELVPPSIRATTTAALMLVINLLGAGPGPWLAGAIGDRSSLTEGLAVTTMIGALAVVPFALAARSQRLQQRE